MQKWQQRESASDAVLVIKQKKRHLPQDIPWELSLTSHHVFSYASGRSFRMPLCFQIHLILEA